MLRSTLLLTLSLLSLVSVSPTLAVDDVTEEGGVLTLTEANFDKTIDGNEFVLVQFYAPWCAHCKTLEPEYIKAAAMLAENESGVRLAKVDATRESGLAAKFGVESYPTMRLFRNGRDVEYDGGRTADEIFSWAAKMTGSED